MSDIIPITIIGGGIIGCAIAYELSKSIDDIFLLEQNDKIGGENQSSRNSGIIHAGVYYPQNKGPLKAKLCVEGNPMLYKFCEEFGLRHKRTGKLIVATSKLEEQYLENTLAVATTNGVPGVEKISGEKVRELEPNVRAISALYVPTTGIVDSIQLVKKLYGISQAKGAWFEPGTKVIDIVPKDDSFEIVTENKSTFETKILINAAGLHSDEIARMVNPNSPYEVLPIRGEAACFYETRSNLAVKMNIYPAPHGVFIDTSEKADVPFNEFERLLSGGKVVKTVGVHVSPTIDPRTNSIGPAYTIGHGKTDLTTNLRELKHYYQRVKAYFPNLKLEDLHLYQAGIQANLRNHYDFVIERDAAHPNCINLVGINSPGLTSSLAIAKHVRENVLKC